MAQVIETPPYDLSANDKFDQAQTQLKQAIQQIFRLEFRTIIRERVNE